MSKAKSKTLPKVATTICPHCWHRFHQQEALFIATHPELIGDPVLGEHEYKRLTLNEVTISQDQKKITDPKGFAVTDQACPSCRLQIPFAMLAKKPRFVSMAGAPSSGKTHYITALIHTLRQQLPREFNLLFEYASSHDVRAVDELIDRLYGGDPNEQVYLDKTQEAGGRVHNIIQMAGAKVELPKPFLFSIRPTPNNIDAKLRGNNLHQHLAFYDCSGEHFQYQRHRNALVRSFGHFAHADALMFTYDPLQDVAALERLSKVSSDPQVKAQKHVSQQDKVLEAVVHQFRLLRDVGPRSRIDIPLLICVQKYDVWARLLPPWATISTSSVHRVAKEGTSGLDIQEINRNSLHIRQFLQDISPMFVAQAESNFSKVRYFAVSALGVSPEAVDVTNEYDEKATKLCVRPRDLQAFRVTDPVLWLLLQWKLIRSVVPSQEPQQPCKEAVILEEGEHNARVALPDTKQQLMLDREYLGTRIVDPISGNAVHIPKPRPKPKSFAHKLTGWFTGSGDKSNSKKK